MTKRQAVLAGIVAFIVLPGPGWVFVVTVLALRGCA